MRRLYNLLFPLAFLLLLPGYLRRMVRRGHYRRHFWQRFGFYSAETRARMSHHQGAIWLQAVSVGEMLVALKLLTALREREPALPLILSTTTTTGYALAVERVPEAVEVIYTPVDLSGAVRRAFDAIRPAQLVIVDGGLWPNQLWEARRRQVFTALVNARLSPRSERRFRRFRRLATGLFGLLDLVGVTEQNDANRWQQLGVPNDRIHRTGSIKFDDAPAAGNHAAVRSTSDPRRLLTTLGISPAAPILLAGSTHPGEEQILGEVYRNLRPAFPDLFLIVAPRHVERASRVRADLEELGLRVSLRTAPPDSAASPPDVLLLDTTGELRDWYPLATLVFVGKSLRAVGGQNPAEAITAGVPVLFGPHMENFEQLTAQLLAAQAAVQVRDAPDLEQRCARLLADAAERIRLVEAARRQVAAHRGAAARTADLLLARRQKFACQTA